jgi:hypothetical protein
MSVTPICWNIYQVDHILSYSQFTPGRDSFKIPSAFETFFKGLELICLGGNHPYLREIASMVADIFRMPQVMEPSGSSFIDVTRMRIFGIGKTMSFLVVGGELVPRLKSDKFVRPMNDFWLEACLQKIVWCVTNFHKGVKCPLDVVRVV